MLEQNVGAGVDARADDAVEWIAPLDDEHQNFILVRLPNAGAGLGLAGLLRAAGEDRGQRQNDQRQRKDASDLLFHGKI